MAPQIIQPLSRPNIKDVVLTAEQEQCLRDLFRNANKVTGPEKEVIVGFIAGLRNHPCPTLGNVLTIRLNERTTKLTLPNGREEDIILEEYFHMNFATGEWKIVKKTKPVPREPTAPQANLAK